MVSRTKAFLWKKPLTLSRVILYICFLACAARFSRTWRKRCTRLPDPSCLDVSSFRKRLLMWVWCSPIMGLSIQKVRSPKKLYREKQKEDLRCWEIWLFPYLAASVLAYWFNYPHSWKSHSVMARNCQRVKKFHLYTYAHAYARNTEIWIK